LVYTFKIFSMILRKLLFLGVIFSISHTAVAQTCPFNITLTGNGATCLQNDTLKLRGGLSASKITWYRGADSVGVATLAPYTIAGRKTGNGSGITPELLNQPQGVFVDRAGNVYISDHVNNRVQKWAPGATAGVTIAGGIGYGPINDQRVLGPTGIFVDTLGNLYVADAIQNRVQKWAPGASAGVTVAGSNSSQGGSGANLLSSPWGIYVTKSGNLYIGDFYNNRVQLWMPNATAGITVAGGNGFGDANNQIGLPQGIFVDANNNVYVADAINNRVQKWVPNAINGITVAGGNGNGGDANQLSSPSGIIVDTVGTMFIADQGNSRIQKWLPGSVSGITIAGGNGIGTDANQVSSPAALWLDSAKNIYIADSYNNRIQKWLADSTNGVTVAGSKIGSIDVVISPTDAVADNDGDVYITDFVTKSVLKFLPGAANGIVVAGGNGDGAAANQFSFPVGLFVDSNKVVYVSDQSNHRIQKWLPGAVTGTTVAGGNGAGNAANQLNGPYGLFVDAQGNIFVADAQNNRVQKWIPGAVSGFTVAGGNGYGSSANQLRRPVDVFVDKTGSLYITDNNNYRIQKWLPGAIEGITVAGGGNYPGSSANQISNPYGLFVDDSLNIFIADRNNHRIQKWAAGADSGITVAGSHSYFGSLNDQFNAPTSIYKDKLGNLLIFDDFNARVQKWPNVVDSTYQPNSPGTYTASIISRYPVCTASSNAITVNTGYTYQFTGNGNWSLSGNWMGGNFPPNPLPLCSKIIVSPSTGNTCILDVPQTISSGANLTVTTGTNFIINGNITIHQ